jgi:hypothetical protein
MGCPITISTLGIEPFVSYTDNRTQEDGSIIYNVDGLFIEPFLIPFVKMNFTVVFLPPLLDYSPDLFPTALNHLMEGLSDILVGFVPTNMYIQLAAVHHTIPHTIAHFTMFTPCPSRVHRMSKVFSVFTLPVWLSMALAFILTSATFWCLENITYHSMSRQPYIAASISLPVHDAWAILMGVSVPNMPKKVIHRLLFLVYVCYCFAIVTVFQAFFVSYLVEPGYGKVISTLDEALDEELLFGNNPFTDHYLAVADYKEHERFPTSRQVPCGDLVECTKRLILQRDITFVNAEIYATYIASTIGVADYTKALCHINDVLFLPVNGILIRGSSFMDRLNRLMRYCMEGGLVDRYWDNINFEARLRSNNEFIQDNNDNFFAFNISHLSAAFTVLVLGYIISCLVFILEIMRNGFLNKTMKYKTVVRRSRHLQRDQLI